MKLNEKTKSPKWCQPEPALPAAAALVKLVIGRLALLKIASRATAIILGPNLGPRHRHLAGASKSDPPGNAGCCRELPVVRTTFDPNHGGIRQARPWPRTRPQKRPRRPTSRPVCGLARPSMLPFLASGPGGGPLTGRNSPSLLQPAPVSRQAVGQSTPPSLHGTLPQSQSPDPKGYRPLEPR